MARPSPTGPIFSAVLAFTLICSGAMPSTSARRAHGRDVRGHLGRLGNDGAVQIADLPAGLAHAPVGLGQQHHGVRALELGRGVGEELADIAQRGRTQQGVGDGMRQGVGVGVAQQAMGMRNGDAAQDQGAFGDQGVGVPAFADAEHNAGHFGRLINKGR